MLKLFKSSLIFLFIVTLSACSYSPDSLKETYNDLALEMSKDLQTPFDLSTQQKAIIDDYSKQLFKWHRHSKLPIYAQNFAALAEIVQQQQPHIPTLRNLLADIKEIPNLNITEATSLNIKLETFAKSLDNRQISQLEQFFSNEYQKNTLEIKNESFVADINNTIKALSRFMNISLNAKQLKLISTRSKQFHDTRHSELHAQKIWNQQIIALLKQKDRSDFSARFAYLWKTQGGTLKGEALRLQQRNTALTESLIKDLIISFNPEQRNKISNQLLSISNTLSEMANE